ncbi:flagellar basal body rod protein FlgC [Oceanibium sediminis]|uniref:flagellar basal body rod protein FlgC n=1 Tax=Oceanibium sediminis TaxID=2026339 RepID=UPI000DD2EBB2|nr:flagellar basal body rod protein FlgC [Oceanibium sediminis]
MSDLMNTMSASASGMNAQASRLRVVTENIANADTPGYQRKLVPFEAVMNGSVEGVRAGRVRLSPVELTQIHDPAHPLANDDGMYQGSNVSLMTEIADAREAQRSYEANLRMFDQARQMTARLLDLLRR